MLREAGEEGQGCAGQPKTSRESDAGTKLRSSPSKQDQEYRRAYKG